MKKVIGRIEKEAGKSKEMCQDYGLRLVSNGSETKKIKTLLGTLRGRGYAVRGVERIFIP